MRARSNQLRPEHYSNSSFSFIILSLSEEDHLNVNRQLPSAVQLSVSLPGSAEAVVRGSNPQQGSTPQRRESFSYISALGL